MKNVLFLTVGAPSGGKSSWIEDNNFQKYTLCPDNLRLLYSPDTTNGISQKYNKEVWDLLYRLVEVRAQDGEKFIIVDACHGGKNYFDTYSRIVEKKSAVGYEVIGVKFHLDIESHLLLNSRRPQWKQVPPKVIMRMHQNVENFLTNNTEYRIIGSMEAKEIIK
jgi:predicted kinase